MAGYDDRDRQDNEISAFLFYLTNSLLDDSERVLEGPTKNDIVEILTKRISALNIPNASEIKNLSEAGNILSKNLKQEKNNEKGINFEFEYLSLDEHEVIQYFNRHNIPMRDYTQTQGQKQYVKIDSHYREKLEQYYKDLESIQPGTPTPRLPHPYIPVSDSTTLGEIRLLTNNFFLSTTQEASSVVVFRDEALSSIDWTTTLKRLHSYVTSNYYSRTQTRQCLLRLINKYERGELPLLEEIDDPSEIARSLLRYESRIPDKIKFLGALKNAKRKAGEHVEHALGRLESLAKKVYPTSDPANDKIRQDILLTGLVQFTTGDIKERVEKEIKERKNLGLYVNYGTLLNTVSKLEYASPSSRPIVDLVFDINKKINVFNVNVEEEEDMNFKKRKSFSDFPVQLPICFGKDNNKDTKVYFQLDSESYNIPFGKIPDHYKKVVIDSNKSYNLPGNILESLAENKFSQSIHFSSHQKAFQNQYPLGKYVEQIKNKTIDPTLPAIEKQSLEEESAKVNYEDSRKTRQSAQKADSEINLIRRDKSRDRRDFGRNRKQDNKARNSERGRSRERKSRYYENDKSAERRYERKYESGSRSPSFNRNSSRSNSRYRTNSYRDNRSESYKREGEQRRSRSASQFNRNRSDSRNNPSEGRTSYPRYNRSNSREYRDRQRSLSQNNRRKNNNYSKSDRGIYSSKSDRDGRSTRLDRDRYNSQRDNSFSRSRGRKQSRDRAYSRSSSRNEKRNLIDLFRKFKNYEPGVNCRQNYNPGRDGKQCLKCFTKHNDSHSHYEFDCSLYKNISDRNCRICKKGFHMEEECFKNYPPNFNSILTKVTSQISEEIKEQLKDAINDTKN